jgi:Flp pilus assembly protein TadD
MPKRASYAALLFSQPCGSTLATRRRQSARSTLPGPAPLAGAVRSLVDQAVRRHENGEFAQAEQMYREASRQAPGHADVHHLLGMVLHQQNRNAEARVEIESAIKVLAHMPHYHNTLGEVLRAVGEVSEAITCYRRALELQPDYLQAVNNLGLALHANGDVSGARDAFSQVVKAQPGSAQAHNNLGIAEQSLGDMQGAAREFRKACDLAPQHAEGWNNLGAALQEFGDSKGAAEALTRAIEIAPHLSRAHFNLSRLRAVLDEVDAAEASVRRAIELEPSEAEYYVHLAFVLRAQERFDEALEALREALSRSPNHPIANNDIAVLLLMYGDFEQAEKHLETAIAIAPELSAAYENLARTRRFSASDAPFMQGLEARALDAHISPAQQVHLNFALGKMWDDRDDAQRAFHYFDLANQAARGLTQWDAEARSKAVDQIIATFDRDWFDHERTRPGYGEASAAPLLIVGMPRSGTTLIEQILASHSQVVARGELDFFSNLAAVMPARLNTPQINYPQCALQLRSQDMHSIARSYLRQFFSDVGAQRYFTDKNPLNFEYLGLAAVMFPNAKFVHVTREPMDTCLSIFTTHFSRDLGFAYDLQEIARFHQDYQRLMAHWRECIGERIYDVAYETVVGEQQSSTRALLDALGLDWEASCLHFHRTQRMVETASYWQVRQPLYSSAVNRWQRYESFLGPLKVTLGR